MEGRYVLRRRGRRIALEYVAGRVRVKYTACSAEYEYYVRAVAGELSDLVTVMRTYVAMRVLPYVENKAALVDLVREMPDGDVLFWYRAFLNYDMKAISAFKRLYF